MDSWHTVVPTALGELTLVRDAMPCCGLYFPNHWYRPDPVTFGPRRADGFERGRRSSASTSPGSAASSTWRWVRAATSSSNGCGTWSGRSPTARR